MIDIYESSQSENQNTKIDRLGEVNHIYTSLKVGSPLRLFGGYSRKQSL